MQFALDALFKNQVFVFGGHEQRLHIAKTCAARGDARKQARKIFFLFRREAGAGEWFWEQVVSIK